MGIFNKICFRKPFVPNQRTETTVESSTPEKPKRDYRSAPGHYKPRNENVRLDNVAAAAGVGYTKVLEAVKAQGFEINRRFHKCFVRKEDAIRLHTYLWNEKA